jgi:hypothetical protein
MKNFTKKYLLYLLRWQLSTPILAVVISIFSDTDGWTATAIANLIGGIIFFWVDKFIFKAVVSKYPLWEIKENGVCSDCGNEGVVYRIVSWLKYDRRNDTNPEYRCSECRKIKATEVKTKTK